MDSKTCFFSLKTSQCGGGGRHINESLQYNIISVITEEFCSQVCSVWAAGTEIKHPALSYFEISLQGSS